jgi:hypothetical protein
MVKTKRLGYPSLARCLPAKGRNVIYLSNFDLVLPLSPPQLTSHPNGALQPFSCSILLLVMKLSIEFYSPSGCRHLPQGRTVIVSGLLHRKVLWYL